MNLNRLNVFALWFSGDSQLLLRDLKSLMSKKSTSNVYFYKSVSVVVSDVGFLGRVSIIRSSWESSVRRACVCASPTIRIAAAALWATRGRGRHRGFSSSDADTLVPGAGEQ